MLNRYNFDNSTAVGRGSSAVGFDAGLRSFMLRIYNMMAIGLVLTGLSAWATATIPALTSIMYVVRPDGGIAGVTLFGMLVTFSPLVVVFAMGFGMQRMKASTAGAVFMLFSVLMGLSLSSIFFTYTTESIARTFFITSATFAGMSLWGYTTKRDLTGMGHFMIMGVVGLVFASIVNLFLQSSALQFAVSVIGVIAFTGLTAYDTQKLKEMYARGADRESTNKLVVNGALTLYLDFINLFIFLLQLLGRRE